MMCSFCLNENGPEALVCGSCARDIAVPKSLLAERDDLIRKRDAVLRELAKAKAEIERLTRRTNSRSA
ncbi:MAG: hypothetical protein E7813_09245 [Bradyrhizobium sp.]|nr:MAG: hypothetical protein E7813_09245 [Bradyrhizobium sp.]